MVHLEHVLYFGFPTSIALLHFGRAAVGYPLSCERGTVEVRLGRHCDDVHHRPRRDRVTDDVLQHLAPSDRREPPVRYILRTCLVLPTILTRFLVSARLEPVDRDTSAECERRCVPNDWSDWASLWQDVRIWTPCENVLSEIAHSTLEEFAGGFRSSFGRTVRPGSAIN